MADRPLIALALGDPSGIGNELAVKALADPETRAAADYLVVGDRRHWDEGGRIAGQSLAAPPLGPDFDGLAFLDLGHAETGAIRLGEASRAGGLVALANFRAALRLGAEGKVDAVCFTPFNKYAMRLGEPDYVDEIGFIQRSTGIEAAGSEFNVLDEVWNARVTSHIPLGEVARHITADRILRAIELTDRTMRAAGFDAPRIAVAGLNPHAGDGGNFGREEIEIIGPAVRQAAERHRVTGPLPSDTVYVRALKGEFDAVLTMYHDQGQIAMKLIGFDRGVTLIGGYPFWIATPAHGTAYDIAGRGAANPGGTIRALRLAAQLALRSRSRSFEAPGARLAGAGDVASAAGR
jgi:4-hydroxythreonine-4-phosphate dehydrogenase